jgi:hypothetical protein
MRPLERELTAGKDEDALLFDTGSTGTRKTVQNALGRTIKSYGEYIGTRLSAKGFRCEQTRGIKVSPDHTIHIVDFLRDKKKISVMWL